MAQKENSGVFRLENGMWGFRFVTTVDGKRKDVRRTRDDNGKPYKNKSAALKARALCIQQFNTPTHAYVRERMTFSEVYAEYCTNGRSGKAYGTIRKQDSLWKNHICSRFGNRYVDGVSSSEVNDYLCFLYHEEERAYKYVEGFLKMFYLIFGQAYSRDYLAVERYNVLCVNKDSKIHMPKMKIDEDDDIVAFSREETEILDSYFHGCTAETAYMVGKYCGLRIGECYGLLWSDIDFSAGTLSVERQMQYIDGIIRLVPLKTRNARRKIYMSTALRTYLLALSHRRENAAESFAQQRHQNRMMIPSYAGGEVSSLEFVNVLENGKLQTINSMKYHAKVIFLRYGLHFKYHYLRHTFATRLAEQNIPIHLLCNQMGHASGKVTERYYIGLSSQGEDIIKEKIDGI